MRVYAPISTKVRLAAGGLAVLACALVLGGQLSLFAMVSNDASSAQVAAQAASATTVVQRDARGGKRS